ncbi:MAG: hypothetical protein V5B30_12720 [Candidatus Accumulibacter delftensis]
MLFSQAIKEWDERRPRLILDLSQMVSSEMKLVEEFSHLVAEERVIVNNYSALFAAERAINNFVQKKEEEAVIVRVETFDYVYYLGAPKYLSHRSTIAIRLVWSVFCPRRTNEHYKMASVHVATSASGGDSTDDIMEEYFLPELSKQLIEFLSSAYEECE